jgi:hypothetical protein
MHAAIGQNFDASKQETISVWWEAISTLKDLLGEVSTLQHDNSEFLSQARLSLPNMIVNFEKLALHYKINLPKLNRGLVLLKERVQRLEERAGTSGGTSGFDNFGMTMEDPVNLSGEISKVRGDFKASIDQVRSEMQGIHHGSVGGPSQSYMDDVIAKFTERLTGLEGQASGEGYETDNHKFANENAVAEWITVEKVLNAGFFWDLFSLLACMSPKHQNRKDKADKTYSAKRINSMQLDNDLLAAMTHEQPNVLFAKKADGKIRALEDGFVACLSYKQLVTRSESYQAKLESESYQAKLGKDLQQFVAAVDGTLLKSSGCCRSLSNAMMGNVSTQWASLCNFIDSYVELTGVANFPKDKAWKVVGCWIASVFNAMGAHRATVSRLDNLGCLENKSCCMRGIMQCHRVLV